MDRVARIQAFVETIWDWYSANKRTLPWRDLKNVDPAERAYKVMVSEIMLQQRQVSRVKIVFKDFLERFPSIQVLAQASNREVLMAWRGMGYNGRALRLRDAARVIIERYGMSNEKLAISNCRKIANCSSLIANFPSSMESLQNIPGIGHYTAAAIRNFAFNIPTPCLDTNIRRILHRTFVGPENSDGTWKKDDTYLLKLAGEILTVATKMRNAEPFDKAQDRCGIRNIPCDTANWHAALMDFGSLIQTKRNPNWDACPLTDKKLMKTTPALWKKIPHSAFRIPNSLKEPGRLVGTKYIPNRIFRGKVIEELRDTAEGMKLDMIGKRVCIDWSPKAHKDWLEGITQKLVQERMVQVQRGRYRLFEG